MSTTRSQFPSPMTSVPSVEDVLGAAWAVVAAMQAREAAERSLKEAGPKVTAMLAQKRAAEAAAAAMARLRTFQGAPRTMATA